jgi:ribosomal protein L29
MKLTLSADVSAHSAETHPKLRRWDQKSAPQAVTGEEIELEDGIKIQFGGKTMQPGDYWCFAARTATGDIDTLNDAPPMGVERSFCRLALVQWKTGSSKASPFDASVVTECPPTFPPLTDIWAEDVFYDDSGCSSIEAENVQEAIDQLCAQRNLPHHNKHLHGWGIVCGLKVVCGPEELDTAGDQVSVIVKPGYALDCEGKDIILDQEQQVAIFDLIKGWEKNHPAAKKLLAEKDGKLAGDVSLIIERDENGKPRLDLRPYDPSDDTLKTMLQGTLLMDFIQECITEPLGEIQKFLAHPTGDFEKGSIVPPERQQLIAVVNLIWQLFKAQYGSHIFLSLKEHTILENLYYKLAEILASNTFCGMFHEDLFPEYPFPQHAITTLFGQDAYQRVRIHPGGELGYALGTRGKIGVFDLIDDVLIEELTFPASEARVQDVAFSDDGKRMYAVALSPGGDTLFASASIERTRHTWGGPKPVCGYSFLTLRNTKSALYGIARDKGLYSMNPDQDVIRPEPVGAGFHAVGHLVMDRSETYAYATDALTTDAAIRGCYHRVVRINLSNPNSTGTGFSYAGWYGSDDIALSPDETQLFIVVDPRAGNASGNKQLLIFQVGQSGADPTLVDLMANTVIRLLAVPGRKYLAISYEDCYWLRLLETEQLTLSDAFHFPVQISPIGMAYGPLLEEIELEKKKDRNKRRTRVTNTLRVYVLNGISTTLTAFPEAYLSHKAPATLSPTPGSAEFVAALKAYRLKILSAFLALMGGVWQSLKDCLCDRFLVDCPTCSPADEVYLAKITIRESEVYRVCNFSKRKYVKSFPTVDYWLSILPVMPLLDKAVEKICCAIFPGWFQSLAAKPADIQMVQGVQMRQTYMLVQQQGVKGTVQKAALKTNMVGMVASDWIGESLSESVRPPVPAVSKERVVDQEVAAAQANLAAADIEVSAVETYDPGRGVQNLQAIIGAPVDLRPGTKVTLYADQGVVRYYTLTEKADVRIETLQQAVNTQKTEIETVKNRVEPVTSDAARPGAGAAVPSTELQTLQSELNAVKAQATQKDKELVALRTKLEALEKKQTSDFNTLRKDIDRVGGG